MPAVSLLIGNLLFILLDADDYIKTAPKYVKCSFHSGLMSTNNVYTLEEIKASHPGVVEIKDLLELKEAWNKH